MTHHPHLEHATASTNYTDLWKQLGVSLDGSPYVTDVFTHKSLDRVSNYERLEFLGDAVINLVVSTYLFQRHPGANEAFLSSHRADRVRGEALSKLGTRLDLSRYIRTSGPRSLRYNKRITGDVLESLFGCMFLQHGFCACYDAFVFLSEVNTDVSSEDEEDLDTRVRNFIEQRCPGLQLGYRITFDHRSQSFVCTSADVAPAASAVAHE